jgi:hypothetical protein
MESSFVTPCKPGFVTDGYGRNQNLPMNVTGSLTHVFSKIIWKQHVEYIGKYHLGT